MAVEAKILQGGHPSQILTVDAGADRKAGELVQVAGLAGVVLGHLPEALKSGKEIAVDTGAVVEVQNVEGSTSYSDGDTVGWDDGNDEAVATGATAKDFDLGACVGGTSSGGDKPTVALNRQTP